MVLKSCGDITDKYLTVCTNSVKHIRFIDCFTIDNTKTHSRRRTDIVDIRISTGDQR